MVAKNVRIGQKWVVFRLFRALSRVKIFQQKAVVAYLFSKKISIPYKKRRQRPSQWWGADADSGCLPCGGYFHVPATVPVR